MASPEGGTRKNPIMQPLAAGLSDDDVRNLAAHFAAQTPPARGAIGAADPAMFSVGQRVAQANRCASCHREDYAGEKPAARIGGQREDLPGVVLSAPWPVGCLPD